MKNTILWRVKNRFYPVRKEVQDKLQKEFFKVKGENILTDEQFEKLHNKDTKILLFEADHSLAKGLYLFTGITKFLTTVNFLYAYFAFTGAAVKLGYTFFYGSFGLNLLLTIGTRLYLRKLGKNVLFAIHYNTATRQLETVYFAPSGSKMLELHPQDIKVIPESIKALRDHENNDDLDSLKISENTTSIEAIYKDTKNGIEWKTVNTGKWYNQDLFLYLLTRHNKTTPARDRVGEWSEENQ